MIFNENSSLSTSRAVLEEIRFLAFKKFSFYISVQMIILFISILVSTSYVFVDVDASKKIIEFYYSKILFFCISLLSVCVYFFGSFDLKSESNRYKAAQNALIIVAKSSSIRVIEEEWRGLGEIDMKSQYTYFRRLNTYLMLCMLVATIMAASPLLL